MTATAATMTTDELRGYVDVRDAIGHDAAQAYTDRCVAELARRIDRLESASRDAASEQRADELALMTAQRDDIAVTLRRVSGERANLAAAVRRVEELADVLDPSVGDMIREAIHPGDHSDTTTRTRTRTRTRTEETPA